MKRKICWMSSIFFFYLHNTLSQQDSGDHECTDTVLVSDALTDHSTDITIV